MAFYNCVKLEYHDFIQYRIYKKPIEKDYEKCIYDGVGVDENSEEIINDELSKNERKEHSKKVSLNRTKQTIYSLAYNNKWDWFVTLTLDPDKIDRFDYSEVIKKVTKWLNNFKSRKAPDLKYILIPVPHKSGAYHFHGLFANVPAKRYGSSSLPVKSTLMPQFNVTFNSIPIRLFWVMSIPFCLDSSNHSIFVEGEVLPLRA